MCPDENHWLRRLTAGFLMAGLLLNRLAPAQPVETLSLSPRLTKPRAITVGELSREPKPDVAVYKVEDYVFGGYQGDFRSPPHADLNPKRAFVIVWQKSPFRFVFSHEGSYCPWFELPSGAAVCFQFFEGNDGWAELFNNWGRQEKNSFVEIMEPGPGRVWVRWTYFGVNMMACVATILPPLARPRTSG